MRSAAPQLHQRLVTVLKAPADSVSFGRPGRCVTAMAKRARILQDFVPDSGSVFEIEVAEGDEVDVIDGDAPPGWLNVQIDGIEGIVPSDYCELITEARPQTPSDGGAGADAAPPPEGEAESAGPTAAELDEMALEDATRRQALFDFEVEPGVIYELPLLTGEIVKLLEEDAPDGWVTVQKLDKDGAVGLVPEIYLGPAPKSNPNAPSEEQLMLRKANEEKAEIQATLARVLEEKQSVEDAKEQAAEEAAERESALQKRVQELKELEIQRVEAARRRIESTLVRQGELEDRRVQMDVDESVWPSTDQRALKDALDAAEQARLEAEMFLQEKENEVRKAERRLRETERLKREAQQRLRKNEEARDANARALKLMPEVKQLFAPTQKELQMCVETVTQAVMKNAEESARLLAKLSLTEGPDAALRQAMEDRNKGLEKLNTRLDEGDDENLDLMFNLSTANTTIPDVISKAADAATRAPLPPPRAAASSRAASPNDPSSRSAPSEPRMPHPPTGRPDRQEGPRKSPRGMGEHASLTRAASFGTRPPRQRRATMPERIRSTVGAAGGTPRAGFARGHIRQSSAPRLRSGRRAPGSMPASTARTSMEASDGAADGVGGGPFGSKALDHDTPDSGEMHTRDPKVTPPPSPPAAGNAEDPEPGDQAGVVAPKIAKVAPAAARTAQMIEQQHLALQEELSKARQAIVGSRYGQIENRGPIDGVRVQQRSAHATYNYLMRQRKAHEATTRRREAFDRNYDPGR